MCQERAVPPDAAAALIRVVGVALHPEAWRYRSAKTGRYVTEKYGKRHPSTTVKESK